ncbi:hypothetical protein ACV229_39135 [Burkholderia sp. MR1-5-21]
MIVVLAYQFVATRGVELRELRFPFPLIWHSDRGIHQVSKGSGGELLRGGSHVRIRMEELFDVQMTPDETGAVSGRLELGVTVDRALSEPEWDALALMYASNSRGFGVALTQSMFQLPWYPWTIEKVASQLDAKPRALQMTLFRECYSFNAALRRCRGLDTLLRVGNAHCAFEIVADSVEEPATRLMS